MNIQILPSALEDLYTGRNFYEQQEVGLGDYFLDSLFSDIDSLIIYAGIHENIMGYFRLLSVKFPYAVYYKIKNNAILIFRVAQFDSTGAATQNYLEERI